MEITHSAAGVYPLSHAYIFEVEHGGDGDTKRLCLLIFSSILPLNIPSTNNISWLCISQIT